MKIYPEERPKISLKKLHAALNPPANEGIGGEKMAERERLESEIVRLRVAEAAIRESRENLEAQLRRLVHAEAVASVEAGVKIEVESVGEETVGAEAQAEPKKVQPE